MVLLGRRTPATPRRAALAAAAVTALLATAACSAPAAPAEPEPTSGTEVEVFTWWASGQEKLALDTLVQAFRAEHPEVTYVDAAVAGGAGSLAKDVLASRLANGDPPDTFQVHGGAELAAHVAAGDVAPLTSLVDGTGLAEALGPQVRDLVSVDGTVYAIPVDVHRANLLWANSDVLVEAGLDPSATYPDLQSWFDALAAVRAAGYVPLALGSAWTQVHLLEVVLLARLGAEAYAGLWDGSTDAMSPAVASAVGDFATLLSFTNANRSSLDWEDAAGLVAGGDAAFTVMGDWALPALGAPVVRAAFPGTDGVYDMVLDAFTAPVGAEHPDGAQAWLSTVAGAQAQAAFANVKGAIPARSDIAPSALAAYPRSATETFRSAILVPSLAHGMAVSPEALDEITRVTGLVSRGEASTSRLQAALAQAVSG
ncbi:ABC transporter substrate-binding protein [Actinotalea sp. M2MS4P-6]|uniref:ABC transporter substrate-binding protein n=1 Tax=Actinotalea sp. M2MS4P-6 TaxID=2983762 RepID=UPI0021E3CCA6|nr:ABC transporter substrate-binding protein [Actinotalea sp. M2MS4P-6]MCV2395446.1 ABC transporter substrate-binding protein [Actinotalea sp. M2MS4P-6]